MYDKDVLQTRFQMQDKPIDEKSLQNTSSQSADSKRNKNHKRHAEKKIRSKRCNAHDGTINIVYNDVFGEPTSK